MLKIESYKTDNEKNNKLSKEKKSLKAVSKKLKNKKEDFEGETVKQTNNNLQQIEEKIKTQKEKEEMEKLKNKIIVEPHNNVAKNNLPKKTQKKAFLEIRNNTGLTITDFDDIFDDIADDFDDMKRKFPLLTLQNIAQRIKQNRLEKQKNASKNENKEGFSTKKENQTPLEEREEAVSDIIFDNLDSEGTNQETKSLTENIEIIAYIIQNFDKLDEEKKKKFMKRFKEIMAHYMEGKIIEVYEITIRDGKIIITGKGEDGKPMTIELDEKNIGKEAMKKIKKMLKNKKKTLSTTKDIGNKKIHQKIEVGKKT